MLALFDIGSWLDKGGLVLLAAIVFAESGLLIGFFLPGDSLLFIAGFLSSNAGGNVLPSLPIVALVTFVAAVTGDQVGYLFGRKVGPSLFDRPQSKFFNPKNIDKAHAFLEKHGSKTIVMARFVPIVRTFAPIVAGVG
jgi:membrane-associated protein